MLLTVRVVLLRFRQAEIEDFDGRLDDHDVAGFQIAVGDALLVRGFKCFRYRTCTSRAVAASDG